MKKKNTFQELMPCIEKKGFVNTADNTMITKNEETTENI